MNRRERMPQVIPSIVAQRHPFVNLERFRFVAVWIVGWSVFSTFYGEIGNAQQEGGTSELYRQAMDKLGAESRIVWLESGSLSLERWEPGRSIELRGVVVEWEPTRLVILRKDTAGPSTFPGDQVIGIEPGWKDESFVEVHRLFGEQQFSEVIRTGQAALKAPSIPRWQQRLLVAEMVQSACALGQWQVAGKIYSVLAQDTPPQLLASVIPLPWSDELLSAGKSMREPAMGWLQASEPELQLLGATWLLGSDQNGSAIEMLLRLAKHESTMISGYAQAQLWRTVLPSEIESIHFGKWVGLRDKLPIALQAGPTMLLGHRLDQSGAWELAVAEWLRIASLHSERYHLKTKAIERAIATCRAAGAGDQADRIAARYSRVPEKSLLGTKR
jgi:hypothetical protein